MVGMAKKGGGGNAAVFTAISGDCRRGSRHPLGIIIFLSLQLPLSRLSLVVEDDCSFLGGGNDY